MNRIVIAIVACTLLLAGVNLASAADGEKKPGEERKRPDAEALFKKIDTDGNGSLSKDEFSARAQTDEAKAKAAERFAKIDTDGNGSLSLEEFKKGFAGRRPGGDKPKDKDNK